MTTYQQPPTEQPAAAAPMSKNTALFFLAAGVFLLWRLGGWALLVVVAAVVVMIMLHEFGHYITAKKSGMKVTEYFLGFGPRLWSFRKGETEYGVKAIPAGAYVRIIGMNNLDEVDPEDEPRTYRAQSYPKRFAVAVAGSTMHFLQALVCLFLLFTIVGVPGKARTDDPNWKIGTVQEGSAASVGGILPGDHVVAVGATQVNDFDSFRHQIEPAANQATTVTVVRDGQTVILPVTLGVRDGHGFLGITVADPPVEHAGVIEGVRQSFVEFGSMTVETGKFVGHLFSPAGISNLAGDVVTNGNPTVDNNQNNQSTGTTPSASNDNTVPDEDRPVSIIGAVGIGSELTRDGLGGFLAFFVMINVALGLVNLIPLPPLDGGHIAVATYERIRSRKGKSYRVDMAKLLPLTYAVVLVLVFIGVSAMFLDIVNPVHIN